MLYSIYVPVCFFYYMVVKNFSVLPFQFVLLRISSKISSQTCRYSCFNLHACSLWMSFGAYVTGVIFQTASFVSFLLISHGYCIVCENLSVSERRTTAALGCAFYLALVGYRASVPYFSVSLIVLENWNNFKLVEELLFI